MQIHQDELRSWAKSMNDIKENRLHEIDGLTWEQFCAEHCPALSMQAIEECITIGLLAPATEN